VTTPELDDTTGGERGLCARRSRSPTNSTRVRETLPSPKYRHASYTLCARQRNSTFSTVAGPPTAYGSTSLRASSSRVRQSARRGDLALLPPKIKEVCADADVVRRRANAGQDPSLSRDELGARIQNKQKSDSPCPGSVRLSVDDVQEIIRRA